MENLHPNAKWEFRLRGYGSFLGLFVCLVYLFVSIATVSSLGAVVVLVVFFGFLILVLVGAEIYARLTYNNWLFDIGEDYVKIESGIIRKKYTSVPYERVQNINISRGIFARIFGYSTLSIETAGQSGYSFKYAGEKFGTGSRKYQAEGYIPAVSPERAEEIREFIMKKIR